MSTSQFQWRGVCFVVDMLKTQAAEVRQSTAANTEEILLSMWKVVFTHHLMCDVNV